MENDTKYFSAKFKELTDQYQLMKRYFQFNGKANHVLIQDEITNLKKRLYHEDQRLHDEISNSMSSSMIALSGIHKEYLEKVYEIYNVQLSKHINEENLEKYMEEISLYAEYSIDYVIQSMNHAMLAILSAIDVQLTYEEKEYVQ